MMLSREFSGLCFFSLCFISGSGFSDTIRLQGALTSNTTWQASNRYIISDDYHISSGVTLTVEDGADICIANGQAYTPWNETGRATLIFDSGSSLSANNMSVYGCDKSGRAVNLADNGGIVFLGTLKTAVRVHKDHLINSPWAQQPSNFRVKKLEMNYLGAEDSKPIWKNLRTVDPTVIDDWDALTFLGVGRDEWASTNEIISNNSGQNGIDVLNSSLRISRLEIRSPYEDGINVTSSDIEILDSLINLTYVTAITDRDLFDLEVDWGSSLVRVSKGAYVELHGIFGDELVYYPADCPPKGFEIGLKEKNYICTVSSLSSPLSVVTWAGAPRYGTKDPDG